MCVGVQKAGTSTIHDILNQNPNISMPIYKETHFFCEKEKYQKGLDYYFNFFFNNTNTKYIGEIDPEYSYFKSSAQKIFAEFGKIKIIFILRNPLDRAFSQYLMTKRRGLEELTFEEALKSEKLRLKTYFDHTHYSYLSRGSYTSQIENYETVFGKDNVKVLFFDDIIKDIRQFVSDFTSFVRIEPCEYKYDIKSKLASIPQSKSLSKIIYKPYKFKKWIGKLIPSKTVKNKIMFFLERKNLKASNKETLTLEIKQKVYEAFFKEDIELLEQKLSKDLSHWKYIKTE